MTRTLTLSAAIGVLTSFGAVPALAQPCPTGYFCVTDAPSAPSFGPNCMDFMMQGGLYSLPYDHFTSAAATLMGQDIKDHADAHSPLTVIVGLGTNNEPCGHPMGTFPTAIVGVQD